MTGRLSSASRQRRLLRLQIDVDLLSRSHEVPLGYCFGRAARRQEEEMELMSLLKGGDSKKFISAV